MATAPRRILCNRSWNIGACSILLISLFVTLLENCAHSNCKSNDKPITNCGIITTFGAQAFELKTISVTRGIIEPGNFFTGEDMLLHKKPLPLCEYDGGEILLSHPSSLAPEDRYYGTANLMLEAAGITIDRINNEKCGVQVDGKSYALRLHSYSDDSDKNKTAAVTRAIVNESDFMLAGYTSSLAAFQTPVAEKNKKLVITAGSSRTSVHADKKYAFGMLPPASASFGNAYRAMTQMGAKTIGFLYDDDFSSCKPEFAEAFGLEVIYDFAIGDNKTYEVFDEAAFKISQLNPDSMMTCTRLTPEYWFQAMRKHDWSPKAQVMFGNNMLVETVGTDAQHTMAVSTWVETLPPIPDAITGWTPEEFAVEFETAAHRPPDYRHVAQSAAISVLVQAIESVGSINDTDRIVGVLQNNTFDTVYAKVSFDDNGQNNAPGLLLQYDADNVAQVALPESLNRGFEIVYPMPSWKKRDCTVLSDCLQSNGVCMDDGTCSCSAGVIQVGNGATASCKILPAEDMTYIDSTFLTVGYTYVGIQFITSLFFAGWTIWNAKTQIVKASQPMFLHLINFGCFVLSLSILPQTVQGEYRYYEDPVTRQLTDTPDESVFNVDKACVAFPWLFGLGFGIVFSALFAKIYRIQKIVVLASQFRRKIVSITDVLPVIGVVLAIESVILLAFTLADPFVWEREVIRMSEDGLTLQSAGRCTSDYFLVFYLVFDGFNLFLLLIALILCYKTWNYPSEFAESRWITACIISYIQILLLAVPILVIVNDDNNISFFVFATIIFMMSISVTLFMFLPKVYSVNIRLEGQTARAGARDLISAEMPKVERLSTHSIGNTRISGIKMDGSKYTGGKALSLDSSDGEVQNMTPQTPTEEKTF
mmetsp:Transcript_19261/g.47630  ORF Transcript_19261/g.47630 Transcript_19261/m.47630 type:complete len:876 (+) Transcript_19261:112-2739(+)